MKVHKHLWFSVYPQNYEMGELDSVIIIIIIIIKD